MSNEACPKCGAARDGMHAKPHYDENCDCKWSELKKFLKSEANNG